MSLIHHLKLNETSGNFADSVGSLVGTRDPSGWVSHMLGFLEPGDKCPVFSTGGSYAARILCGSDIWEGSGEKTITCWFKEFKVPPDTGAPSIIYYFHKSDSFALYTSTENGQRTLRFFVTDGTTTINEHILADDVPAFNRDWNNFAVVKNGNYYQLWINGYLAWSGTGPSSIAANTNQFAIGNKGDASPITYSDDIYFAVNDFKVWDHALTKSELLNEAWSSDDPPYLDNLNPGSGDTGVSINSNLYLEIKDDKTDVDNTKTIIKINRGRGLELVYQNSSFQGNYNGTVVEDTISGRKYYKITIYPPTDTGYWANYKQHNVYVYAEDDNGNILETSYSFTTSDQMAPYVANEFPTTGSSCVPTSTMIGFDILEELGGTGVDSDKITVKLWKGSTSTDMIIDGVFQSGFDGFINTISNGYHVIIEVENYLDPGVLYTISVDGQDLAATPNVMPTYYWSFSTCNELLLNSKMFLVNSGVETVLSQTSYFQSKIKDILAGSNGNISLNAETTLDLSYGASFEIRTMKSGRLDRKLNTQLLRETELGTGQITYNEERAVKGSFIPPKYVIEDNNSNVYGLDLTMSKHIYSSINGGNGVNRIAMCDRNDESFFIFIHRNSYPIVPYNPQIQSIAKAGKTDSNPQSGSVSIKSANDAVKVSEDRYLIVTTDYYDGITHTQNPSIYFTIIDDSLNVIYQSDTYHFLEYLEFDNSGTVDRGYLEASLYSDGSGNVYCVVCYSYDFSVNDSKKLYFLKSSDGGYNWDVINEPGTNDPLTIDNPVQSEIYNLEPQTTDYEEQLEPKLSYDHVNDYFMLTFTTLNAYSKTGTGDSISGTAPNMTLTDSAGLFTSDDSGKFITITGATTGSNNGTFPISYSSATQITYTNSSGVAETYTGNWTIDGDEKLRRTVTMFSKDFINWNRLNYPIYAECVGTKSESEYLNKATGLFRFKDQYWSIGYTNADYNSGGIYKNSVSLFNYDNQIYGLRRGVFWNGDESSNEQGAELTVFEAKVFDDIYYLVSRSFDDQGFVIHAVGIPTNIPDKTPYSHAYFGNHDEPSNKYGYSKTTTGSPSISNIAAGLKLLLTSSDTAYYSYGNLNGVFLRDNGFKFKAIAGYDTAGGSYVSGEAQRIYVKIPTPDNLNHFYFTVRFGNDGIMLVNETTPSEVLIHNQTISSLEFIEITVIAVPRSDNTNMDVRLFVKNYSDGTFEDTWSEATGTNVFTTTSGVSAAEFTIGLKAAPTSNSDYIWKAIYLINKDLLDDIEYTFNDDLINYTAGSDDEMLVPIPMTIEDREQESIQGLIFKWYGTDAFKDDKWNFNVISDFEASNILCKCPSIIYRSEVTSADQYITFRASDDDLGMFVFDLFTFLNTNMKYIDLQANDDGSTWSPAPFEKTIDMTLDTGTIAATASREDSDLLVVRCTDKDWIDGELIDKYLMLEYIYEEHNTTPALDNYYKNVAFKILDNGSDYILISTKGLLLDELNTDDPAHNYKAMSVVSGTNFLIYDTRIASIIDDAESYVYLRIKIRQSASYATAWGSNQPSLPNERSWQIGEFDFGLKIHLTQDVSYPYSEDIDSNVKTQEANDGRIEVDKLGKEQRKFYLDYRVLHDDDKEALEALFNSANESGRPFWYIPDLVEYPEKVYMVVFSREFSEERMLPEYQNIKMILDEVT